VDAAEGGILDVQHQSQQRLVKWKYISAAADATARPFRHGGNKGLERFESLAASSSG
jgi:hypothetical protein